MRDVLVTTVNESYELELRSVTCPTRLLWGERDTEVPVAVAEEAMRLLPDARLRVLPGIGHHVTTIAPDEVRSEIEELL